MEKGEKVISIGQTYMPFDVAKTLHAAEHRTTENIVLGRREKEVLELIKDGYTNGEIATQLNLSIYAVDTYRKSLLSKLDARNTVELIKKAFHHRLITMD